MSPDGRWVATAGAPGNEVRIWDTSTFRQVGPDLPAPVGAGEARARFTPDGSLVAVFAPLPGVTMTGGSDISAGGDLRHGSAVWVYPVGRAAWTELACRTVGRSLTHDEWDTYLPELAYDPACRPPG